MAATGDPGVRADALDDLYQAVEPLIGQETAEALTPMITAYEDLAARQ